MNIGIDIDGVVNDLSLFHITCGTEFCYKNNIITKINSRAQDSKDIFNWNQSIDNDFWRKHYLRLLLYPEFIRSNVSEVSHILQNNGINIFFISARKNTDLPSFEKRSMHEITRMYLQNCGIIYEDLFLCDNKWDFIKKLNIDLMIEDNPQFFASTLNSIPLICFDTPYNQEVCGNNIIRVYSWYDILSKTENYIKGGYI